jgi:hypothetical protein
VAPSRPRPDLPFHDSSTEPTPEVGTEFAIDVPRPSRSHRRSWCETSAADTGLPLWMVAQGIVAQVFWRRRGLDRGMPISPVTRRSEPAVSLLKKSFTGSVALPSPVLIPSSLKCSTDLMHYTLVLPTRVSK